MHRIVLTVLYWLLCPLAFSQTSLSINDIEQITRDRACAPDDLNKASNRILELRAADQSSRINGALDPNEDTARRIEIAAIYARGCLQRAEDFRHSALIFQHGNSPEHYYQAWFFASRAVALGDKQGEWLIPRAVDRYLYNMGYKQLFGTQVVTPSIWDRTSTDRYLCLWPIEESFSDEARSRYGIPSILQIRSDRPEAKLSSVHPETGECQVIADTPPRGTFPGIW